tara:strand:- start:211 stop:546 length:336 start_codon:yes stop_codon:yes gene_type:complete
MAKTPAWQRKEGKNPKGGLNAAGRASYKRETGGTLKAPVKKSAKTPQQKRRKGSFLARMGSAKGPLYKNGEKTRLKLSLEAWGHRGDKASAVRKGRSILSQYQKTKEKKDA